jgi:hypothetical protein
VSNEGLVYLLILESSLEIYSPKGNASHFDFVATFCYLFFKSCRNALEYVGPAANVVRRPALEELRHSGNSSERRWLNSITQHRALVASPYTSCGLPRSSDVGSANATSVQ